MVVEQETIGMPITSLAFAPVSWWAWALRQQGPLWIDLGERYQKMSYRNRYCLASPHGKLMLSVPLAMGRNQRTPIKDVKIANEYRWQSNHWKTILSLYGKSPFFEHFEQDLRPLYERNYVWLYDWNHQGFDWVNGLLRLGLDVKAGEGPSSAHTALYQDGVKGWDGLPLGAAYYQVFADRAGFIEDCSILDMLFCEGMYARELLRKG